MKRSEVNSYLVWAKELLEGSCIRLPRFAYWSMDEWRAHKDEIDNIVTVGQGWDITDYGLDKYKEIGTVLFTVRNGSLVKPEAGVPYAEKYLLIMDGQRLPAHYHAAKTEDIINRGGGLLSMRFYNSKEDGSMDFESDVTVYSDGLKMVVPAGEEILFERGNSVTITPGMYHIIAAKGGDLIAGEVSSINDDKTDNYFSEPVSRFSTIEEDEPILHPLCNEYDKL